MDEIRRALWQNLRRWDGFIALGFGSGMAPRAPGTFGTMAAVPPGIALLQLAAPLQWTLLLLSFALGVLVCERVGRRLGVHDHGAMVWDEFVGYWLVLVLLPTHWVWWLAAFGLFRFFDILKPWPIRPVERRFAGGFGVMIDDVLAGLLTLAVLWPVARWFAPSFGN